MSKEVTWRNVDSVWFEVEIFKVRDLMDPLDDLIIKDVEYHTKNETFSAGSLQDIVYIADTLLERDDDYNYAIFYLCRHNDDPLLSEEVDEETLIVDKRICIGDSWSEEVSDESNSEG